MSYHAYRSAARRGRIAPMFGFVKGGGVGMMKLPRFAAALTLALLAFALLLAGAGAGAGTMGTGLGMGLAPAPAAAQGNDPYVPPGGDYDLDDDGLIEIRTLAQLNAIRWNTSGTGFIPPSAARDNFHAAFPGAIQEVFDQPNWRYIVPPLGCPYGIDTEGVGRISGWCHGYELANDLDFDTNNDGSITAADGDLSWGAGARASKGWDPIPQFGGNFQGNGYVIKNMKIDSDDHELVGLFEKMGSAGMGVTPKVIDGLRLVDVDITAEHSYDGVGLEDQRALRVGPLVAESSNGANLRNCSATGTITTRTSGTHAPTRAGGLVGLSSANTTIAASWANVAITATSTGTSASQEAIGGLVGLSGESDEGEPVARITASYALGNVSSSKTGAGAQPGERDPSQVGGLVGYAQRTTVTASYSTGTVTNEAPSEHLGGLFGRIGATVTVTDSYWDTDTSNFADDGDDNPPEGKSTADLQGANGYAGIYANWDVDVDNADGDDNPATGGDAVWDFGTATQYPEQKDPLRYDSDIGFSDFDAPVTLMPELTAFAGQTVPMPECRLARVVRGDKVSPAAAGGATCRWHQAIIGDVPAGRWLVQEGANATFIAPTGLTEAVTLAFAATVKPADGITGNPGAALVMTILVNPAQVNELTSLTVNAGGNERPLTPAFASNRRSFDTYVGAYTGRAEIAMTPSSADATISFNRDAPATGERTETVSLAEGHNRFTITVTPPEREAPADGDAAEPLEPGNLPPQHPPPKDAQAGI